jgi:peptide/nickel transport system ATP-binding protein
MAVVEKISHRVAVMYLGQIVEMGTRAQIFEDPRHAYTRRLLDAVPIADPGRRRLGSSVPEGEVPASIHPLDYIPELRQLRDIGGGHLVAE